LAIPSSPLQGVCVASDLKRYNPSYFRFQINVSAPPLCHRIQQYQVGKFGTRREIVMQAQYVAAKQSEPFPMKLSSRPGAAQCRESLARTPLRTDRVKAESRREFLQSSFSKVSLI
jgi:hypothetical protein